MLSDKAFDYCMGLLGENYGKKPEGRILGIWREYLDESLSDEELGQAVKHAVLHSRFMPTAAELVEYVQGGKETKALQEWQLILRASATNTTPPYLSARGSVALQAVGGLRAIGQAEDSRRNQLERSFVTVWCQCSDKDGRSLPQSQTSSAQQRIDEEVAPVPDSFKQQMEELKQKMAMNSKGSK